MTPIKQTKFHSDEQKGNCFAAAIASVLDMPIHAVPEFEELDSPQWQEAFFNWLGMLGLDAEVSYKEAPKGYAIAGGKSIRGVKHAVVVFDGYFVHDPHPSNCFIFKPDEYWVIKKDS